MGRLTKREGETFAPAAFLGLPATDISVDFSSALPQAFKGFLYPLKVGLKCPNLEPSKNFPLL